MVALAIPAALAAGDEDKWDGGWSNPSIDFNYIDLRSSHKRGVLNLTIIGDIDNDLEILEM